MMGFAALFLTGAAMGNANGTPLSVGAKHYSQQTMEASDYTFKMDRSDDIFLNVDLEQLGVGGNNSWGATALPRYQLKNRQPSYSYRLRPIKAGDSVEELLN